MRKHARQRSPPLPFAVQIENLKSAIENPFPHPRAPSHPRFAAALARRGAPPPRLLALSPAEGLGACAAAGRFCGTAALGGARMAFARRAFLPAAPPPRLLALSPAEGLSACHA
jgi:hypothetical protein